MKKNSKNSERMYENLEETDRIREHPKIIRENSIEYKRIRSNSEKIWENLEQLEKHEKIEEIQKNLSEYERV